MPSHSPRPHLRAISGRGGGPRRWLGAAAAMALSAVSLLVPATALALAGAISITPSLGSAGTLVTITGSGFTASSVITPKFAGATVAWTSGTNVSSGACTATAAGAFSCAFTVPSSTAGLQSVTVTGSLGSDTSNTDYFNYGSGTATTTTLTATTYTPTVGTTVTLTATLSPTAATGTVTFNQTSSSPGTSVSGVICSAVTLSSGVATCLAVTYNGTVATTGQMQFPFGSTSATISAVYSGDSAYATSTGTTTLTNTAGTIYASSMSLAGSPNPSAPNQAVTITANATTTSTSPSCATLAYPYNVPPYCTYATSVPTGYMWFLDSGSVQPICPPAGLTSTGTNSITGTCTYTFTTTGVHTITGYYCPSFPTATSSGFYVYYSCTTSGQTTGNLTQNVNNQVSSSTTLTANPTTATAGQNVTFTAAVSGSGGTPTGTVTVTENTLTRCTITLASGSGTCQSAVSEGTHTLVASYAGDSGFTSSTSSPVTVTASAGAAAAPSGGTTVGGAPSLPASLVTPPNTNIAAIRASLAILADIPTADVTNSYFGASAVVSELTRPPLATMPFAVGCYSGPNATADEQTASVLFGTKPAGSQFVIFFLRGTRGYSFDVAVGNYCWVDLM